MASCSSVVDLGNAAELDDATSKLFFSDSCAAAGPGVPWPVASEIQSTLTRRNLLVAQCSKHGVPSELTPFCAQHLGWRACTPPPVGSNKICVYSDALDAGLRFPLHDFYVKVLRHYKLAPSQLAPNSWSYLAAFVLLCQDAGVEAPLVSAFRYFFTICAQRHKGKPTGWHHFQPNHDVRRRLFTGATLRSWGGWKSRFFFLDCPSGWKCQVEWGKPKRQDTRRVQLTDTAIEKLKAKVEQIGCIDLKVFLANREMPVGDPAALAPLQSVVKAEAGAAGASAAAIAAAAAAAENASTTTRKRSRLSPPAVLSQPEPLPPTSPPTGLAPVIASSTGGSGVYTPPPGFSPIRASSTRAGRSGHFSPPQQQSLGGSTSAPREVPGMRARARAQAVSIGGSSEVTPPTPQMKCASDALQLWEAIAKAGEQAAMIAKLNQDLHRVKTWNTQWQNELRAAVAKHADENAEHIARLREANDRSNHLNEEVVQLLGHLRKAGVEVARLQADSVEVAQLKAEHAAERAQLKEELAAEAKRLKEELTYNEEQLKNEGYDMGARDMMNLALSIYKNKGVINPDDLKVDLLYSHQGAASRMAVGDQ